jgi:iron complex transport system ATP-binding protein
MSLCAEHIHFSYRDKTVLAGVDFTLQQGEVFGLLGPNGSGKSTCLKTVLGYLKPSSGRIVFARFGSLPYGLLVGKEVARRVAFVPQQTALHSAITVFEAILMGRLPHLADRWSGYGAEDKKSVREVVEALGLCDLVDRNVTCLSGGELQKVIIARCLVQESDILLLDEATAGLDLNHAVEIMEFMRRKAKEESKSIVAVLHDVNLASQYCDRIALLKKGRLRYIGTPEEVISETVLEEIYGIRAKIGYDDGGKPFVLPRRIETAEREVANVC